MTQYIDPNSGAAPQPGGYVGPHGVGQGFAQPEWEDPQVEETRQLNETEEPVADPSVEEVAKAAEEQKSAEADKSEQEKHDELVQAQANPAQTLSDLDENGGNSDLPEPGSRTEEEAADAKALETEGVNVNEEPADEQSDEEQETETEDAGEAYDPSQHSVDEVVAYVEANPDQKDAVVAAETDGKNRSTLLSKLS